MRAIIGVLDSFGVGATPDAARFGEQDADTFGSIARACAEDRADKAGLRQGPLDIPHLVALGLGEIGAMTGKTPCVPTAGVISARYGRAVEKSFGKDTPSGHWEMMGTPVEFDWGYFKRDYPSFPKPLIDTLTARARLPGVLGEKHASGTHILEELGEEHIRTGKPIVYTSADSVFQIAAHETHFGLKQLYEVCHIARALVDEYNIGRVIARPFVGESAATFKRTGNRHDYAMPPHMPTLLDIAVADGREVIGIGKISDIFAARGVSKSVRADGNEALFDAMLGETKVAPDGSIVIANFVDFDTLYGHRRDLLGYAAALEAFDKRLPELQAMLRPDDLVVLSADHGCDPTWPGSDHTREHVPIIAFGPNVAPGPIGTRDTFADIAQSVADHLGMKPMPVGRSFL
jgi:phosphopentomutase